MRKFYLLLSFALILASCNENSDLGLESSPSVISSNTINKTGSADGVKYELKNLKINPKLIKINSKNAIISSSLNEINNGKLTFQLTSPKLAEQIIPNNVILISNNGSNSFRVITFVNKIGDQFQLDTTEAELGDIFGEGTLEFSVDTEKAEEAINAKRSRFAVYAVNDYNKNYTTDWFQFLNEYKSDVFTLSPNTKVTPTFNLKIGFTNGQKLPSSIESYFQLDVAVNPYLTFNGNTNKTYTHEFAQHIPTAILEQLKKVEIDITIPTDTFLGDIPATVSINEVKIPTEIKANIAKASNFTFNSNGTLKVGFAFYNNVPGKTSKIIYENSIVSTGINDSKLNGDLETDMKVIIYPKIRVYDSDLINVSGNISLGVNTFSVGNTDASPNAGFGSKGDFNTSAVFNVSALGIGLYSTDLFNNKKELWNIGSFNTTMTLSNFKNGKTSILPCSGLNSYNYDVTLDYKYPISGKILSGNLVVSYDIYADNGALLDSKKNITVTAKSITANNFKFSVCVPFRRINIISVAKTSYIKNLVITDENGYVANKVINSATNAPYTQMTFTR